MIHKIHSLFRAFFGNLPRKKVLMKFSMNDKLVPSAAGAALTMATPITINMKN